LDHFGSLPQVLEAPVEELMKVPGVGENTALYLNLITATGRYYALRKADRPVILNSTEKYGRYLLDYFSGMRNETVYALCLDAKCKVLCCRKVGEGDVNSASVPMRRVAEIALSANATAVVLAHNHPSGVALPSREDVQTTQRLAMALGGMDIILADHIVVADDDFVSMTQSQLYDPREFSRLI
jgi:DNA repair protein RadC